MKNINIKFKKITIVLILFLTIGIGGIQKSFAGPIDIPFEAGTLAYNITQWVSDTAAQIQNYMSYAQTVANTAKSGAALAKQVTNMNLSTVAQNIGADQLLTYGETVLNVVGGDQGSGININTNGNQVITNLKNFVDKVGTNEIRKSLSDLADPKNLNIYSPDIKQQITNFTRNIADTATGKIVNFTLPYIAREEICSDPKLKDIITNGEPADYIKPLAAVGNVDINKACNSATTMPPAIQATFVGLAKAGYAGPKTDAALADPANTKSGVIANAMQTVIANKEAAEETQSKQAEATGLAIGQQFCFDKNGKKIDFDLASNDNKNTFCYSQNSTTDQSGSVVKDRLAASLLSPYFSMLARADATNNQLKNCGASSASSSSGMGSILNTVNKVGSCISTASNIMNTLTSVLNIGGKNVAAALSGEDNPYARLADNLQNIINTQNSQAGLYADADESNKDYIVGATGYTVDDLKNAANLYAEIREFNTDKLNNYLFTYTFLNLAVDNTSGSKSGAKSNKSHLNGLQKIFGGKKKRSVDKIVSNTAKAATGLSEAAVSESKDLRSLIKEMAKNNYKEQQIQKLLNEIGNSDIDTKGPDTIESLNSVLGDALTQKDFTNMQLDWQYIPQFTDQDTSPLGTNVDLSLLSDKEALAQQARNTALLYPPIAEREGPYTSQNIQYLRIRAYNFFKVGYDVNSTAKINTSQSTLDLLTGYGMSDMERLNPSLPRAGAKGVTMVLEPDQIKSWSEITFCNELKIANTVCNDLNIQKLMDIYTENLTNEQNSSSTEAEIDEGCLQPQAYIDQACTEAAGPDGDPNILSQCNDSTQKASMLQDFIDYCAN